MNILIVDDEKLIVDDLMHEVKEIVPGASIDGMTNSVGALERAREKEYDVALIDIDMPDMDGLTLARRLIAFSPAINIIFITGYGEYAIEAHELYCSAFLVKPVGNRKLKKAFENLRRPVIDITQEFYQEHYSGEDVLGKRLEICREQRGLSRQELADLMNVSRQTIYRWELGERIPDLLTFIKLTRILGVDIEDIVSSLPPSDAEL